MEQTRRESENDNRKTKDKQYKQNSKAHTTTNGNNIKKQTNYELQQKTNKATIETNNKKNKQHINNK